MSFSDVLRLRQLDLTGRRVFLRADLDVPVSPRLRLTSDAGVRRIGPTLRALTSAGCKVLVAGHAEQAHTLPAVAELLGSYLNAHVPLLGADFTSQLSKLREGQVALAPNLDEFPQERDNDARWAASIARAVDVFVTEASSTVAEVRASTVALPRLLQARGVGLLLGNDLNMTRDFVELPAAPYTAVIGGSGLLQKAAFLRQLVNRVDALLLGGVIGSTFLVASGWEPGSTAYEPEALDVAKQLLATAAARGVRVGLPTDGLVRDGASAHARVLSRSIEALSPKASLLDIGPETRRSYCEVLAQSTTVLWNGSMGADENPPGQEGTRVVAEAAAASAPYSGVAGESSVTLARALGLASDFRWTAKSGDAALALLAGATPPGIESLRRPQPSSISA